MRGKIWKRIETDKSDDRLAAERRSREGAKTGDGRQVMSLWWQVSYAVQLGTADR